MSALPLPAPPPANGVAPDAEAEAAVALYAMLLRCAGAAEAARRLVQQLAAQEGCTRVALGWREAGRCRVVSVTGLAEPDPQLPLVQAMAGAMDEALDQGRSLAWPGPDPETIRLEQEALHRLMGGQLATLPLGQDGEALGAVLLQWAEGRTGASADRRARVEARLVLAAPLLHLLHLQEAPWWRRFGRWALQQALRGRQPSQQRRRRLAAAGAALLLALAVLPMEQGVSGRARIEGAEQRVLVAPTQGFLKSVAVRPGDRVTAGSVLAELMERDLALERERWSSQLAQHENTYAAAMARTDRGAAAVSLARMQEAQAELSLVEEQLARSQITAPFDAIVIQGDLQPSVGAPVKQGDMLFTLATEGRHRVIVEIDEAEIARVRPGAGGALMLSSLPWDRRELVVERITPLARVAEGRNVFEVQARLSQDGRDDPALRPGLQGRARVVVGRWPPLWGWGRALAERARVAWWTWVV